MDDRSEDPCSLKLGPLTSGGAGLCVHSPLLEALFRILYPPNAVDPSLRPIENIWIQDFNLLSPSVLEHASPLTLQSYRICGSHESEESYDHFPNIVHLGEMIHLDAFDLPCQLTKMVSCRANRPCKP